MLANLMHRKISTNKENLEISYDINGWDNDENLKLLDFYYKKISENRELDIVRGSTSIGPQRDDIILKVNNVNISSVRFPHAGTAVFRIRRFIRNFTP